MTESVEETFFDEAFNGQVEEVLSLLRDNPGLNVNWNDNNYLRYTALHVASENGQDEVVKVLLAHPHISVNMKDRDGFTPFSHGCLNGEVFIVQLMLKDPRVDISLADNHGCTPLWRASYWGYHEVVEWLIASGRDLGDINKQKGKSGGKEYTALDIARKRKKNEWSLVASLLEKIFTDPEQTRYEIRLKLGLPEALAAGVFALTIFLCEGLLQLKPVQASNQTAAARFFTLARRLPMELQMILCHRVVGSVKESILAKDSEPAFKNLARILLFESLFSQRQF